ncbi:hypothetical protein [Desulfuromonas thiophila]|uniref:Uncharacterized protein n=1 Tax=Desulfuromonas thiophila TaxID=57664 RepID=A0A1G7EDI1_9BACT|nr:hypothetical protein [Desulfuromonas thiophila]SDE61526.1 hypothetical protein SAMN05661003_11936 [Desulfuromonas thiophila]
MEDLTFFKDLFEESFPVARPELRSKFRSFLASDRLDYKWLFSSATRSVITQGDIVSSWPSFFFDGEKIRATRVPVPVIMLEHTCDMSIDNGVVRNQHYSFAPLFPFSVVGNHFSDSTSLKRNQITNKIYVGHIADLDDEYVADLDMVGCVKASWLHSAMESGKIIRICSLSDAGYFFILAKLTAHFLRADTSFFPPV